MITAKLRMLHQDKDPHLLSSTPGPSSCMPPPPTGPPCTPPPTPMSGSTSSRKRRKGSTAQIFEEQAPRHHKKKTLQEEHERNQRVEKELVEVHIPGQGGVGRCQVQMPYMWIDQNVQAQMCQPRCNLWRESKEENLQAWEKSKVVTL